ncbi:hypothetical protein ACSBR2_039044 [Camellia fascicularis]
MEACLDDLVESGTLNGGQDLLSDRGGGDSNAIILPEKKRNKKKDKSQVHEQLKTNNIPKLTKSKKRKRKKIEEEKEKAILLSKSIETLELYFQEIQNFEGCILSDMVFMKYWSVPPGDQPLKAGVSPLYEIEPNSGLIQPRQGLDENYFLQPVMAEREVITDISASLGSSKDSVCTSRFSAISESGATLAVMEVAKENSDANMQEDAQGSLPTSSNYDRIKINRIWADGNPEMHISNMSNSANCPLQKVPTAPVVVHVSRPKEIENKRKDLPIVMMEQEIMEAINENITVIICGETGCGFGSDQSSVSSGIIGVTQPRRVAVLATAKRVAFELGFRIGKEVGFQVRHDRRIGDSCSIKFMTDGILLREVHSDFLLKKYSIIILDEAHERSLNTDILIGMLSRVTQQRQIIYEEQQCKVLSGERISPERKISPLKLVLMSATLRVEDFVSGRRIFRDLPPVIEIPTRQYPVTIHFSKRTEIVDYIGQAYKKVLSIHKRLLPGGILVFVTGQREVEYLCQKLRKASKEIVENSFKRNMGNEVSTASVGNAAEEYDMKEINEAFEMHGNSRHDETDRFSSYDEDHGDSDDNESNFSDDLGTDSNLESVDDDRGLLKQKTKVDDNLAEIFREDRDLDSLKAAFEVLAGKTTLNPDFHEKQVVPSSEGSSKQSIPGLEEKRHGVNGLCAGAMCVLPLYAMLPASAQLRVFEEIKKGDRLVVVATNVAETSLTIPGIKYVVDTGREKVKNYNSSNGMETFEVQWISKPSAAQRAGRAGRTGPGHCYRLYSSAVFNNIFPDFSSAEISKIPVDGIVLLMKSLGIDKVSNFPFPTPPEVTALFEAERCLKALEALDSKGRLTSLGKAMAQYPMSPRHSRMLLTVIQIMGKVKIYRRANLVLGYALAAAAALSLPNPFVMQFEGSHTDTDGLKKDESGSIDSKKRTDKEAKLRKKKLKESAKVSRAKFSNLSSDALTITYALQCFELSGNSVEFCDDNALHLKTMEEMSKLRKQLLQLVFNQSFCGLQQEFSWTHGTVEDVECAWRVSSDKYPLLLNEEELLGQAICAGWADRVAKRVRRVLASEADIKVNASRYQACMVKEPVFLHRWSSVAKSAPEFLVYNPKPYYDPLTDQVFCWVIPTFGPHLWQFPLHGIPIKDDVHRVAVFAFSLLEGHVLPCLRSVRKFMVASPGSILRPEASGHRRVGNLLNKLKTRLRIIDSCTTLREAWNENPRELLAEILDWFQEGFSGQFEELWLEMHCEVLLDPKERFPKRVKRDKKEKYRI